ncbi:hypothetical protein MRB53_023658 [Persea americana]|uniref:Uncharacterized protein n=1 Tax=Persea americana TaxID=3435 RepID=A0ACC2LAR0_PERAE|nr:hypothetical protein MRB53_023658 [Persea americana]
MTIRDGDFTTFVRGKTLVISPSVLASFLDIEEPEEWDYPLPPNQPLDKSLFNGFGTELEVDGRQLDAARRIRGAINRLSLQQLEAHLTEGEDDDGDGDAAEGEQDSVSDCLTRLQNKVHALNANINAWFTSVDESLATILARLGHQ